MLDDADLAILGAPAARYADYAADVHVEYAHVPDPAFRAGRAAILRGFLDRPRIYTTATGAARWEKAARTNLAAELADLSDGADLSGRVSSAADTSPSAVAGRGTRRPLAISRRISSRPSTGPAPGRDRVVVPLLRDVVVVQVEGPLGDAEPGGEAVQLLGRVVADQVAPQPAVRRPARWVDEDGHDPERRGSLGGRVRTTVADARTDRRRR